MAQKKQEKNQKITLSLQQLIEESKAMNARLSGLGRETEMRRQMLSEMFAAKDSLKQFEKSKGEETIMVDLGAGVYVDAKIEKPNSVKRSIAGNVLVQKKASEAIKALEEDIKKIEQDISNLSQEIAKTRDSINGINNILAQIQKQQQMQMQKQTP